MGIHLLLYLALFFFFSPLLASTSLIPSLHQQISALRLSLPKSSATTRNSLSSEPCVTSDDCLGEHSCIILGASQVDIFLCGDADTPTVGPCFCFPLQTEQCPASDTSPDNDTTDFSTPAPGNDNTGFSSSTDECFVLCRSNADCRGKEVCDIFQTTGEIVRVCVATCEGKGDCLDGEVCFLGQGSLFPICVAEATTERIEGELVDGDGVCIDADALSHFGPEEMVYDKHVRAWVVCDAAGSCATPGHMVRFRGKGMMMKTYCELVGCVRMLKHVNSPRWRRGLAVPSKTEGLEFTAFAARYETRWEEGALGFMVRMRL